MREISLIAVTALVVSGLNLSYGFAGQLQFTQIFTFAAGCYVTMALATRGWTDILALAVIGGVTAAVIGAVIAIPSDRIGGWAFALTSFLSVLAIPSLVSIFSGVTGGLGGLFGIPRPTIAGRELGAAGLYEITMIVVITWFAAMRNLITSRCRVLLGVMRGPPVLAHTIGYHPLGLKTIVSAIGAFPTGVAGCLFGFLSLAVSPGLFTFALTVSIVAASILGGARSVYGAILGAAALQVGPLNAMRFDAYAPVVYGLFLVVAGVLVRGGLSNVASSAARALADTLAPATPTGEDPATTDADGASIAHDRLGTLFGSLPGALLEVNSISVSFGGEQALRNVSFVARPGEVTAITGTNGSGKTTLLNVICGFTPADRGGGVQLGASTLSASSASRIARCGVARTFQTPITPPHMTASEVVAAGGFRRRTSGALGVVLRSPAARRCQRSEQLETDGVLAALGLGESADVTVGTLPLGAQRLIDVGRALCARPGLLVLDEPTGGLSAAATARLSAVIGAAARAGATVLMVEHDMGFVADNADVTYQLHDGRLTAGPPAITADRRPAVVAFRSRPVGPGNNPLDDVRSTKDETRWPCAVGDPANVRLELRSIRAGYGRHDVIRTIDLQVQRGTIEAITGRAGSGKTTLLRTIAGTLGTRNGVILVDGADVGHLPPHQRVRAGVGLVEDGAPPLRHRTVLENIELGTMSRAMSRRARSEACAEILQQFPTLQHRGHERAGQLSGGQRRLLAIGQALAAQPRVLLLDDLTSGLAPMALHELFEVLRELADSGVTVLIADQVTPDLSVVADHVTTIVDGTIDTAVAAVHRAGHTGAVTRIDR